MIIEQRVHTLVVVKDETLPGHISITPLRIVFWYAPNDGEDEIPFRVETNDRPVHEYSIGDCLTLLIRLRDNIYKSYIAKNYYDEADIDIEENTIII